MAAPIRSVCAFQFPRQVISRLSGTCRLQPELRHCSTSTTLPEDSDDHSLPPDHTFDFDAEALAQRGYLRNQKAYDPPKNIISQVFGICSNLIPNCSAKTSFDNADTKFKVLAKCSKELGHTVPNSLLHRINNVGELIVFYKTKVDTRFPLDKMKTMDLPKNLHVLYNYTRFHPDTDTMFDGVSVFTKDSTIVTGVKTKKKYSGYIQNPKWPYDTRSITPVNNLPKPSSP